VVPSWRAPTDELTNVLHALDGASAGRPSGSPLRGLLQRAPTGRNFYSVDPKACQPAGWETGSAMASRC